MNWFHLAVMVALLGIYRQLRLIYRQLGGKLTFLAMGRFMKEERR